MEQVYTEGEVKNIAENTLTFVTPSDTHATILALKGELGAGKTTLTKAIAEMLGVIETVISPTFVIAKFYHTTNRGFDMLVHVDAYRIEDIQELAPLGWDKLLTQPRTLVVVEWPERITEKLPPHTVMFSLEHTDTKRVIRKI